ncbi:hypothetical protein GCM10010275_39530 [Streptomyces litmocidini]|nr:hypothetical protein GCM10010275_39530 [Streptomyces litmocidini]
MIRKSFPARRTGMVRDDPADDPKWQDMTPGSTRVGVLGGTTGVPVFPEDLLDRGPAGGGACRGTSRRGRRL